MILVLRDIWGWLLMHLVVASMSSSCVAPESFRLVEDTRSGNPLNERLCVVYSRHYQIRLGGFERLHPFDINKYAKVYLALLTDGFMRPQDVYVPSEITRGDLLRVHTPEYLERLKLARALARYLEFGPAAFMPGAWTDAAILSPFRHATGGTLLAARLALRYGAAVNLGGGYHHAEPDAGGGFCIYADMPVAIRVLQAEGMIRRALVVDLDVHQGNGTAVCFEGDDTVFTFDMHQQGIYPIPKEANDLDVPLRSGTGDNEYLTVLRRCIPAVFERAAPDIVFLQAGVDVLDGDPLADLRLSPEGIIARDAIVFAEADRRNVPIVMVLGGGYSDRAWNVQYRSIRTLIESYGLESGHRRHLPRAATLAEKAYAK